MLLYNLSIFIGKILKRGTEMYLPFENYSEKLRECTIFPEVLRGMLRNFREQKKLQFSILMLIILLLAFARADKARESFNKILTQSRAVHVIIRLSPFALMTLDKKGHSPSRATNSPTALCLRRRRIFLTFCVIALLRGD